MNKAILCWVLSLVFLLPGSKIAEAKIDSSNNESSDITVAEEINKSEDTNITETTVSETALPVEQQSTVQTELPDQTATIPENNTDDCEVLNENGDDMTITEKKYADFSGSVTIYKIWRDTFYKFLEEPSLDNLINPSSEVNTKVYTYPQDGEYFINYGIARFPVKDEFIDFAGNSEALKNYLSQNNIVCEIEQSVVFETPNTPMTIWVKTDIGNFYITVNENYQDLNTYVTYKLYDQTSYYNSFKQIDAKLIVKGTEIAVVNMHNSYSDLPLTAVLKALGATIQWQSDTVATISYKGYDYILNLADNITPESFSAIAGEDVAPLLIICGGCCLAYASGNELMVDSITLNSVLYRMDESMIIRDYRDKAVVEVFER